MRKILSVLLIIAMIGMSSAFNASLKPVNREATPDKPAVFHLDVTNQGSQPSRYVLNYDFIKNGWIYFETSKTIQPGETRTFNITFSPGEDALQQSYSFTIYVTEFGTNNTTTLKDYMVVQRTNELNVKNFNVPKTSFKPGESVEASITVENLVPRILSNYSFKSKLDKVKILQGDPIAPGASKTYNFNHKISKNASPQEKNFTISLNYRGNKRLFSQLVTVEEVRNITGSSFKENKVLWENGGFTVSNYGNSNVTLERNLSFKSYLTPVLNFEPDPETKATVGENVTYGWTFNLEPGETREVNYTLNYWWPLAIASVILVGLLVLRSLSGSIKLVKEVEELENGEIKVSIEIINRKNKDLSEINIRDFVPNVAKLHEDFELGRPELKRTTEGIEMEWALEDFKPGEKRVIQYRVEPKVEIEEGIELPSAKLLKDGEPVSESSRK